MGSRPEGRRVRGNEPPAVSLWKALDYLLRRRNYLLAFRRFRARPRRPADLSRLVPGLGTGTATQLVQLLVRARLLKRLESDGSRERSPCTLTAEGGRLLDILQTELRRLDALCRKSLPPARQDNGCGGRRGGAWVVRRLLRLRGAMALLAQLPAGEFAGEQFVHWVKALPGASVGACLHLLMYCGLVERTRTQHPRHRDYQLSELGRQTQLLLAILQSLADEGVHDHADNAAIFFPEAEPKTA
ncbi:hypothetical protein OPIT5_06340 [Opitutaceae bacterium TAV5]|nr:hypothetical protein OPIT5_06340 [Opitutaceae bacterium TAV5]